MTNVLKVIAFVIPLGFDSFAVASAMGASYPTTRSARARVSTIFVVFETGMPVLGLLVGAPLARVAGVANYLAAATLVAVGLWMLVSSDKDEAGLDKFLNARGFAMIGLGVSISLDEFAIGFSLGVSDLPVVPVLIVIAVQTFLVVQLGMRLGSRVREQFRETAERIAGVALICLGIYVALQELL